jgi:hypothetical protein
MRSNRAELWAPTGSQGTGKVYKDHNVIRKWASHLEMGRDPQGTHPNLPMNQT